MKESRSGAAADAISEWSSPRGAPPRRLLPAQIAGLQGIATFWKGLFVKKSECDYQFRLAQGCI